MPLGTVLVVEDDPAIRRAVADALQFHGYAVREAPDGRAGLDAALGVDVDLVLLDLLMPRMDGLSVLGELRKARARLPVIILTARGQEQDRVKGLKAGADDYIVKPFSVTELIARVEAVLRRSAERPGAVRSLRIAGRLIDFERREATLPGGGRVMLSETEARVLEYLSANRGRAVAREELLSRVWGVDPRNSGTRTVDMAIARLREQLGDDPGEPAVVLTVRGKGYMLAGEAGESP
jgi:two-component system, OmpR family, alkaline phosphatase synthesis response regulator PhoP